MSRRASGGSGTALPEETRPEDRVPLKMLRAVNACFARGFHRLEVLSPCRLPRDGPAILTCNHTSGLDPALIQSVTPRLIVWMMTSDFYDRPNMRWLFEHVEAIRVRSGMRDPAATRAALRAIGKGRVLGIFPEGRIERHREVLPFQPGAIMLSAKTGVPIYPAALDGSQRDIPMIRAYLSSQAARVTFGNRLLPIGAHANVREQNAATTMLRDVTVSLLQAMEPPRFAKNRNNFPSRE